MRFNTGYINREKSIELNKISMHKAKELLGKGHIVLIFPSAGDRPGRPWKKGIGNLILYSWEKGINFNLVKVKIIGLNELNLLWHFLSGKKFFRKVRIYVNFELVKAKAGLRDKNAFDLAQTLRRTLL